MNAPTTEKKDDLKETKYGKLTHSEILTIIFALVLAILMAALDQTIVTTAMPTIAAELHGLDRISWLITAYLLAQTISIPFYGKLGDLIGRKRLLLFSIVLFMFGSALAGISQTMTQLIGFRALQGLGAGGLMVTAMAIIGDVVPARERGKYIAFIMPIFGLATVFGPTLGGFFIEHLSWRWIFYINMPIGVAAFIAVTSKLHLPARPLGNHKIDYWGSLFLAGAVACLVFLTSWGGSKYAWDSSIIAALGALVIILTGIFIWIETKVKDPVFPLWIFKNRIFVNTVLLGVAIGIGLFGSITFLPTFLQIVSGASAIDSGLLMLPLSIGMLGAAITTGNIISKTGHYKIFPIIGTILGSIGMYLLSRIGPDSSLVLIDTYMFILGMGIGAVMPVLTQVAQNAVPKESLGVATSGVNFFRQIGGAIGVSVAGSLFTARLHSQLTQLLPPKALAAAGAGTSAHINLEKLATLPPEIHHGIITAFGTALPSVFLDFVPVLLIAVIIAILLPEIPLATRANVQTNEK